MEADVPGHGVLDLPVACSTRACHRIDMDRVAGVTRRR